MSKVDVIPSGAALGADVTGIDLRNIDADTIAAIRQAWLDHLVIRIRGANLSDDDHVKLSSGFGELVDQPVDRKTGKPYFPDNPKMTMISNIRENGEYIGALGDSEVTWHSDMAFTQSPPTASFLRAIEIPDDGGNTWFASMYRAYEELPKAEREMVTGKQIKIGDVRDSNGNYRYGRHTTEFASVVDCPGPVHELVRVHPETGRKALYIGMRKDAYILDMPVDESEELLDYLWNHATQDAFTWAQDWHVGDLIFWDNRCTLHRRDLFSSENRRLLHRTVVAGEATA